MFKRFSEPEGKHLVIDALRDQLVLGGNEEIAGAIYEKAEVLEFSPGNTVIEEAAPDNDIYFILAGTVSIQVNGREIAVRTAGQHIGEMAVVDPAQGRSADVVAENEVVVAKVSAGSFSELADTNPRIWRNVARELANRLRQRNRFISFVNPRPVVFVGCSAESLPVAQSIQSALQHDPLLIKLWTDDTFEPSSFPIESLERELHGIDFAVLILSTEDRVESKGKTWAAPRDNIVFELGLFMGAVGRQRTFLLCPEGVEAKIPTDLAGMTALTYRADTNDDRLTYGQPTANTNSHFNIDSVTGKLTIARMLDYDTNSEHSLTIRATDLAGETAEARVTIKLYKPFERNTLRESNLGNISPLERLLVKGGDNLSCPYYEIIGTEVDNTGRATLRIHATRTGSSWTQGDQCIVLEAEWKSNPRAISLDIDVGYRIGHRSILQQLTSREIEAISTLAEVEALYSRVVPPSSTPSRPAIRVQCEYCQGGNWFSPSRVIPARFHKIPTVFASGTFTYGEQGASGTIPLTVEGDLDPRTSARVCFSLSKLCNPGAAFFEALRDEFTEDLEELGRSLADKVYGLFRSG